MSLEQVCSEGDFSGTKEAFTDDHVRPSVPVRPHDLHMLQINKPPCNQAVNKHEEHQSCEAHSVSQSEERLTCQISAPCPVLVPNENPGPTERIVARNCSATSGDNGQHSDSFLGITPNPDTIGGKGAANSDPIGEHKAANADNIEENNVACLSLEGLHFLGVMENGIASSPMAPTNCEPVMADAGPPPSSSARPLNASKDHSRSIVMSNRKYTSCRKCIIRGTLPTNVYSDKWSYCVCSSAAYRYKYAVNNCALNTQRPIYKLTPHGLEETVYYRQRPIIVCVATCVNSVKNNKISVTLSGCGAISYSKKQMIFSL